MRPLSSLRRQLARFVALFRAGPADDDLAREIRAHLQLLEDEFVGRGLTPADARAAARRAFGGVEQAKERQRDARSFRALANCWLDVKLGVRMLVKYPGLTIVGGAGMAIAIAIATAGFGIARTLLVPAVPLPDGDRLVSLQTWDTATRRADGRILHDVVTWREELTTVVDIGAHRTISRNLIARGVPPEPVAVAEMTSSGFRAARVPPLLGRPLLESDERADAPAVVVIGYDVWRTRFSADPSVVGQTVQLGATIHTIVGVMPEGFAFPVNHRVWVPLRVDPARYPRREGPSLSAFGRLAPGATVDEARAQLRTIGERLAADYPDLYGRLQAQVHPYTYPFTDMANPQNAAAVAGIQLLFVLLLAVVAANVAILVYARTAGRRAELAVRTALGASRPRIVGQLFTEALVLSLLAAAAGLAIAASGLARLDEGLVQIADGLPFWMDFTMSPAAVAYVLLLGGLAAAVIGVIPALKATGGLVQNALRELGAGASGLRLGRTWSLLVVAQVGFAVALLPPVVYHTWQFARQASADAGFAAGEFLTAQLTMEASGPGGERAAAAQGEFMRRYAGRAAELLRQLEADPGAERATFAVGLPGEEATVWAEIEGVRTPSAEEAAFGSGFGVREGTGAGHEVRFGRVAPEYFEVFGVPVLAGRGLAASDLDPASPSVVVNRSFAEDVLGGRSPLGRRLRYVGRSGDARPEHVEIGRWYEIVGVVEDFPREIPGLSRAKLYHAASPANLYPLMLAVRVREGPPAAFTGRLREISAAAHPELQLRQVAPMDEALGRAHAVLRLAAGALAAFTMSVVLLSGAGIYALMSFTVTQRRKEIGIRAALGADARRLLGSVLGRASAQIAAGAVLGAAASVLLDHASSGDLMQGQALVMLPVVAVFMTLVGLAAAMAPVRRGLRIQPVEALRE